MKITKEQQAIHKHKINVTLRARKTVIEFEEKMKKVAEAMKHLEIRIQDFNKG